MAARDDTQMEIARAAGRLFVAKGVDATSGADIAAEVGIATRTVWRHFRNKESCVQPLLVASIGRFARVLRLWPLDMSLEDHLRVALPLDWETAQTVSDGVLAVQLVTLAAKEPDIRTVWLDSYHQLEAELRPILAARANRAARDFEVRLCAATIVAAVRVVDETVSVAAMTGAQVFAPADLVTILAGAIRDAATLPICDPVAIESFGARAPQRRA